MAADTVLSFFHREQLPVALAALHRGGYGTNTRVMDALRGDLVGQLQRAGIKHPPTSGDPSLPLVMVYAPGRVPVVVDILQRTGAQAIHVAERTAEAQTAASLGLSFSRSPANHRSSPMPDQVATIDQS